LWQAIDIAPVNDEIETERDSGCANYLSRIELPLMGMSASDFIRKIGLIRLKTQLQGIEARVAQLVRAILIQTYATRDEVGVKVCLSRAANEVCQIMPDKRFAPGKTNLQYAETCGFANHAAPFVGR
jgi:hypothetical protein